MVREDYIQLPYEVQAFMAQLDKLELPLKPLNEDSYPRPDQFPIWCDREEWHRFNEAVANLRENFMRWFLYEIECETFCKGFVPISPAAKLYLDAGGVTPYEYFRRDND